jgi:hypothetical protein
MDALRGVSAVRALKATGVGWGVSFMEVVPEKVLGYQK